MTREAAIREMAAILKAEGWEPDSNVCRCGHHGGDHTSWGNWCLICEPPQSDAFASFSDRELWDRAVGRLIDGGIGLVPEGAS